MPFSLIPTSRRRRQFAAIARDALLARGHAADFTHVAWAFIAGGVGALGQLGALGYFLIPTIALALCLLTIIFFDVRFFIIPDQCLAALTLLGGVVLYLLPFDQTMTHCLAAAAASCGAWLVAEVYRLVRGRHGLGFGDVKFLGVIALWLGFGGLGTVLLWATLSASLSLVLAQRTRELPTAVTPIPFGAHLALGFWMVWVYGSITSL